MREPYPITPSRDGPRTHCGRSGAHCRGAPAAFEQRFLDGSRDPSGPRVACLGLTVRCCPDRPELHARYHHRRRGAGPAVADSFRGEAASGGGDDGMGQPGPGGRAMRRGASDFVQKPWENRDCLRNCKTSYRGAGGAAGATATRRRTAGSSRNSGEAAAQEIARSGGL